jgi:phosphatidylglycerophosphate synthase
MEGHHSMLRLWREMDLLSRTQLICVVASLGFYCSSWLPAVTSHAAKLIWFQLVVMALIFCTFLRVKGNASGQRSVRASGAPRVDFPPGFWVALLILFAFFLVNFIYLTSKYSEHAAIPSGELLRVISSVWAFMLLCAAGFSHWAGIKIRAARATT